MKITDEYELSGWAYYRCEAGDNNPEIRNLIIDQYWIFRYCYMIEDIKEMWTRLKNPGWSVQYCKYVCNRPEIRKNIYKGPWSEELKKDLIDNIEEHKRLFEK